MLKKALVPMTVIFCLAVSSTPVFAGGGKNKPKVDGYSILGGGKNKPKLDYLTGGGKNKPKIDFLTGGGKNKPKVENANGADWLTTLFNW